MRRAAAKLVAAIIVSQPELLPNIYPDAARALVARFKEREESVKADIFSAFVDLVHMVRGYLALSTCLLPVLLLCSGSWRCMHDLSGSSCSSEHASAGTRLILGSCMSSCQVQQPHNGVQHLAEAYSAASACRHFTSVHHCVHVERPVPKHP